MLYFSFLSSLSKNNRKNMLKQHLYRFTKILFVFFSRTKPFLICKNEFSFSKNTRVKKNNFLAGLHYFVRSKKYKW